MNIVINIKLTFSFLFIIFLIYPLKIIKEALNVQLQYDSGGLT